jgi:hypothetical protein
LHPPYKTASDPSGTDSPLRKSLFRSDPSAHPDRKGYAWKKSRRWIHGKSE